MHIKKGTSVKPLVITTAIIVLGFTHAGTVFAADASPQYPHPTIIVSENLCTSEGGTVVLRPDGTRECYGGRWDGAEIA